MQLYKTEDDIDFFEELYKSLDVKENDHKKDEDNNLCLITNQPLTENHIKMNCGHKFNYGPLFLDIKNHKQKFNNLEGHGSRLKQNEIRCPYCRTKQSELLPYYSELKFPKIHGVNFMDPLKNVPKINSFKPCEYLTPNPLYNESGFEPCETNSTNSGNCKFYKCFFKGLYQLSKSIEGYADVEVMLCNIHNNKKVKEYNQELKLKAKEETKKAKEEAKKAKEQNIVLCNEILKFGSKKGSICGCKAFNEGKCKRHTKKNVEETIEKTIEIEETIEKIEETIETI
jgi:hypothetical protein